MFKLTGGAIWLAACARPGDPRVPQPDGFLIVQISDTHWGYQGPANPDPRGCFERALAEIAAWPARPDLVIHTGDVTDKTPDGGLRAARLAEAKQLLDKLGIPLRVLPGEHDAALDRGAAYQRVFGEPRWAFAHRGVHFIGVDNSLGALGDDQLRWLQTEVDRVPRDARLVVFAHRPLFALAKEWDWFTADGDRALAILGAHADTTVFYGHIHQANIARTGTTTHVSARALAFPLPAPLSVPEKHPLPWDATAIDHGLGYRAVVVERGVPVWVDRALVG
jgi:3',5'-cyclic AMP phosphodiesterase CpdA